MEHVINPNLLGLMVSAKTLATSQSDIHEPCMYNISNRSLRLICRGTGEYLAQIKLHYLLKRNPHTHHEPLWLFS